MVLASFIAVAITSTAVVAPTHDLQQPHDVRRREEVQAQHISRTRGAGGNRVDVEIGGVAGEDRAGFGDAVQAREHVLLDRHLLEHRLDHEIAVREIPERERAREQRHVARHVGGARRAPFRGALVVAADHADAAIERLARSLDQHHRDAGREEIHRDAAAHGAGTDHADACDGPGRHVGGNTGNLRRPALGEEGVALRRGLRAVQQFAKQALFLRDPGVEGQVHGRLDGADRVLRREETAELPRVPGAELREQSRRGARGLQFRVQLAHLAQRAALGHDPAREGHGRGTKVGPLRQHVQQAHRMRLRRRHVAGAGDHLQRRLHAYNARQAL
jgi:hypothetical protein